MILRKYQQNSFFIFFCQLTRSIRHYSDNEMFHLLLISSLKTLMLNCLVFSIYLIEDLPKNLNIVTLLKFKNYGFSASQIRQVVVFTSQFWSKNQSIFFSIFFYFSALNAMQWKKQALKKQPIKTLVRMQELAYIKERLLIIHVWQNLGAEEEYDQKIFEQKSSQNNQIVNLIKISLRLQYEKPTNQGYHLNQPIKLSALVWQN